VTPTDTDRPAALPLLDTGAAPPGAAPPPHHGRSWPLQLLGLVLALTLGGIIGLYFQGPAMRAVFDFSPLEPGAGARDPIALPVERIPSAERVAAMASGDVIALGRLQPEGGIVSVALPQGAGDARVAQVLVTEGEVVSEGQVLAVLDSLTSYEATLTSAESTRAIRRAALAQVRVQVAAAEAELRAQVAGADVALQTAETELERVQGLFDRGAATEAALEDARLAAASAQAELARLEAALTRYGPGPGGLQVDVAVAEADLAAAEAAVAQAESDLDRARLRAPRDGTILDIAAQAGERPPAEGLLRMGRTAQMEAELEVFQTLAPRIAAGQSVALTSGVLGPEPLTGTVARIGTLVGRQNVTADDPSANTDARVLQVTVALDAASSARAAGYVNLEVVGRIAVPGPAVDPEPGADPAADAEPGTDETAEAMQ